MTAKSTIFLTFPFFWVNLKYSMVYLVIHKSKTMIKKHFIWHLTCMFIVIFRVHAPVHVDGYSKDVMMRK